MNNNKLAKLLILFILFMPFTIKAEDKLLYDVLKNEAESNGLAREYTGEHHDSYIEEPSQKIYHWYAEDDDEGTVVTEKSNVLFAGMCWRVLRTTDTGGVKLFYRGVANNNKCGNDLTSTSYTVDFNNNAAYSIAYQGFMYNPTTALNRGGNDYCSSTTKATFGNDVSYSDGTYTLINTSNSCDPYHHYMCCGQNVSSCETVYYVYFFIDGNGVYSTNKFIKLTSGKNMVESIEEMLYGEDVNQTSSLAKRKLDNWYINHLLSYSDYLEETIFCNDRTIKDYGPFNPDGGPVTNVNAYLLFSGQDESTDLSCPRKTDMFSISNSSAQLTYSVGLASAPELYLFNNDKARYMGNEEYSYFITPEEFGVNNSYIRALGRQGGMLGIQAFQSNDHAQINPVVSLKAGTLYTSGDGSSDKPYVIKEIVYSNITINNASSKGAVLGIDNTTDIENGTEITFSIRPKVGYLLSGLSIKDINDQTIDYEYDELSNEYSFIMPNTDVTITTSYSKVKSSISIEIVNETKDLDIELNDVTQVEYGENVKFKVIPIDGYRLISLRIVDSNDNILQYSSTNVKDEYQFTMPALNVTIIPSYERVESEVIINNNDHTKEFQIQVNDVNAVVYGDEVKFTVIPAAGYELVDIEITDEDGNRIDYQETNKENEYRFIMPDTNVTIKPIYNRISLPIVADTPTNPNTGRTITVAFILLGVIVSTIIFFIQKKKTNTI